MSKTFQILAAGLVTIGVVTAAFAPGRQTVAGIKAGGTATSGVFKAAEGM